MQPFFLSKVSKMLNLALNVFFVFLVLFVLYNIQQKKIYTVFCRLGKYLNKEQTRRYTELVRVHR